MATSTPDISRPAWDCVIPAVEIERLANAIERDGYGILEGYISQDELAPIQRIARAAVERNAGEYVAFTGPEEFQGTMLEAIPKSGEFNYLCQALYEFACKQTAPPVSFYQITRMLKGISSAAHSHNFHYDSYMLTVLMPIDIPTTGSPGDLLLFPNIRPLRKNYIFNLLDKILVENKLAQTKFLRRAYKAGTKAVSLRMVPGNIYFFWGYRTLHTNQPCDPDKLRVTALLHYGDPHKGSRLRSLLKR